MEADDSSSDENTEDFSSDDGLSPGLSESDEAAIAEALSSLDILSDEEKQEARDMANAAMERSLVQPLSIIARAATGTSSKQSSAIYTIHLYSDANVKIKSWKESILQVNGAWAYCIDPMAKFSAGTVTAVNMLDYGLSQDLITQCALIVKYSNEYPGLTDAQRYLCAQCLLWRYLNGIYHWNAANTHVDNAYFNLTVQGQAYVDILNKVAANYQSYIGTGTVWTNGSTQPVAQFSVAPAKGYLAIAKKSSDASITDDNPCYSLEGAEFRVYSNNNPWTHIATLTTKSNGWTDTLELSPGTYWVWEATAPKGYARDDKTYQVTVTSGQTTWVENDLGKNSGGWFIEQPQMDPVGVLLRKVDPETYVPEE